MSNSYKKYQELLNNLKLKLSSDLNKTQIIEIKNNFINKYLSPIYDELKLASIEEKKELGKIANHFKSEINNIVNDILNKVDENLELSAHQTICDVMIESTNLNKANLTPLSIVTNDVIAYFNKMGFKIVDGDEVIHEKYNFDYLNIDKNHPARAQHDSYYVGGDYLLRTHNTAITLQQLENNNDKDIRVLCYGNVYRNDEDDMTHSHQFMQVDIIWANDRLSVLNLKWLINGLIQHIFGKSTKTRYRLSYFPFTEPSFEVDMTCNKCEGKGCPMCKYTGWIEILGCGMLNQNVFKFAKTNHKVAIAAGMGIDRLTMLKYGFNDIRDLYGNDFRILKQFKNE